MKIKERFLHSFVCLETLQTHCFSCTPCPSHNFLLQLVEGCVEFAIQCLKEFSICRLLYKELLSLLVGVFYYCRRFSSQDLLFGNLIMFGAGIQMVTKFWICAIFHKFSFLLLRHAVTQPEDGDEEVEHFKDVVEDEMVQDGDEMVQDGDEMVKDGDEMVKDGDETNFFQDICEGIAFPSHLKQDFVLESSVYFIVLSIL